MITSSAKIRKRIILAVLFFIIEIGVLIWPMGLLREERIDFLSGEGSYALDGDYETENVCQIFRTPYSGKLKSIGIVLTS